MDGNDGNNGTGTDLCFGMTSDQVMRDDDTI